MKLYHWKLNLIAVCDVCSFQIYRLHCAKDGSKRGRRTGEAVPSSHSSVFHFITNGLAFPQGQRYGNIASLLCAGKAYVTRALNMLHSITYPMCDNEFILSLSPHCIMVFAFYTVESRFKISLWHLVHLMQWYQCCPCVLTRYREGSSDQIMASSFLLLIDDFSLRISRSFLDLVIPLVFHATHKFCFTSQETCALQEQKPSEYLLQSCSIVPEWMKSLHTKTLLNGTH